MDKCQMCGFVPPAQNSFKPNIMSEYIHDGTGEMIVLNDNVETVEIPNRGKYIRRDLASKPKAVVQQKQQLPPPPATVMKPTIIPAKEIPASMIKTPAEIAATPKAAVTATETKSDIITP